MTDMIRKSASVPKKRSKARRKDSGKHTGYFYAEPDFWSGVASTWDLFGNLYDYDYSRTRRGGDTRDLYRDYHAIGRDFWEALLLFESERSLEELPKQYRLFDADKFRRAS
jgi:hypothetical protein